jgi:ketosteroid isomerase-like protein
VKLALVLVAAVTLVSCGRSNIDTKEAVRKGVIDYLEKRKSQTGLDVSLMNVDVSNVTFEKNEARATVTFQPKDTKTGAGGMSMTYVLERRGDQWVVKGRQESGANPHGGGMPMPGSGAMGSAPGGAMPQMPPNHPPMGAGAGTESKSPETK